MGERGQVLILDDWNNEKEPKGVYLYTHWGATKLTGDVKRALAKKWRWDNAEYLARIIFDEMKRVGEIERDEYRLKAYTDMGETGFGIGLHRCDDIWRLITIDTKNQEVIVEDNGKEREYTFEEYIKLSF